MGLRAWCFFLGALCVEIDRYLFYIPQSSAKEAQKPQNYPGFARSLYNEIYVTDFTLRILRNYSSSILLFKTIDNAQLAIPQVREKTLQPIQPLQPLQPLQPFQPFY